MISSDIDLLDPAVVRDPHPAFAELRSHGRPVWLERHRAWIVAEHGAVNEGFRDLRLSSDRLTPMERRLSAANRDTLGATIELLRGWMVFHDPPDHTRLREPLRRAFTPARLAGLRPRITAIVDELCDEISRRDEVDLLTDFTFPLPAIVIAELLGVPAEDREDFKHWSDQLSAIVFGSPDRAGRAAVAAAGSERFSNYFAELIERYRSHPEDNLVSALIAVTEDDPDGAGLAADELVGACTMLLFGGHETTTTLVSNSMRSLMSHPDERRRLIDAPDLIGQAVEELHRYDGSTKVMVRVVGEAHERGGESFEPGQTVFLGVMAANRDPSMFDDPDQLDLTRANSRSHLGFGYGIHFCLGAALARLEAEIAIGTLVRRFPEMSHDPARVVFPETLLSRSVASLPVSLRP
ncbi:MAG: cytochrome P450 [Ilumatobacteraceae bacterium]